MIPYFKKRFLIKQLRKYHKSIKRDLKKKQGTYHLPHNKIKFWYKMRRARTIQQHSKRFHNNQLVRIRKKMIDVWWKHKYNYRKIKMDDEFYRNLNIPCCDNCVNTTVRRSTGVAWCIFRMQPEFNAICDLYHKKTRTSIILENLCHWTYCKWVRRRLTTF
jgi:hypothetical protein